MRSQRTSLLLDRLISCWLHVALGVIVPLVCLHLLSGCDGSASYAHPVGARCEGEIFIEAPVQATDVNSQTLTVLDLPIRLNDRTRLDNTRLAALAVGDFVEVHGFLTADGAVAATCLEREAQRDNVEVRGPVDIASLDAPQLFVLGIEIQTDADTVFENGRLTRATFFARAQSDDLIEVEGQLRTNGSIRAEDIDFDDDDGDLDDDDDGLDSDDDDDGDLDDDDDGLGSDDDDDGDLDDDDDGLGSDDDDDGDLDDDDDGLGSDDDDDGDLDDDDDGLGSDDDDD